LLVAKKIRPFHIDEYNNFLKKINKNEEKKKIFFNIAEYNTTKDKYNYALAILATEQRRKEAREDNLLV
jgi:hypothetical protein